MDAEQIDKLVRELTRVLAEPIGEWDRFKTALHALGIRENPSERGEWSESFRIQFEDYTIQALAHLSRARVLARRGEVPDLYIGVARSTLESAYRLFDRR